MDTQNTRAPSGPAAADVAQMLRELIRTLTEEECRELLETVDFLRRL